MDRNVIRELVRQKLHNRLMTYAESIPERRSTSKALIAVWVLFGLVITLMSVVAVLSLESGLRREATYIRACADAGGTPVERRRAWMCAKDFIQIGVQP